MVGVPGKYKGCETCRRRRVKVSLVADIRRPEPFTHNRQCSNERPYCSNCVNSGRQCEGYERERVFITGTEVYTWDPAADGGRGAGRVAERGARFA